MDVYIKFAIMNTALLPVNQIVEQDTAQIQDFPAQQARGRWRRPCRLATIRIRAIVVNSYITCSAKSPENWNSKPTWRLCPRRNSLIFTCASDHEPLDAASSNAHPL